MRTTASLRLVTDTRREDLAASVARASSQQVRTSLRVGLPEDEAGWVNCGRLLSDMDGFASWRASLAEWLDERYGEAPERTTAGYIMTWYLGVPGYLAALLFHHERRVPSLRAENLAFRMASTATPPRVDRGAERAGSSACQTTRPRPFARRPSYRTNRRSRQSCEPGSPHTPPGSSQPSRRPCGSAATPCGPRRPTPWTTRCCWRAVTAATRVRVSSTRRCCSRPDSAR